MKDFFYEILNLSLSAAYLVPIVLVMRLMLKKAPRWTVCLLWGLVALRLVMPFSLESEVSLHPGREPIADLQTQWETDGKQPDSLPETQPQRPSVTLAPAPAETVDWFEIFAWVWFAGACAMALYGLVSYRRLKRKVRLSLEIEKGVFACDGIGYPFLLGVFRPKVYLPSNLEKFHAGYVISHEKAHVKRGDHLWKPLGFALLTLHWFNPLLWVAYLLLCRDIEAACDEKVVREMDNTQKEGYSRALLACSMQGAFHRGWISACPVAFGETGVKARIKGILYYKKPAFWVILIAVLACIAVGVFFLTDPARESNAESSSEESAEDPDRTWEPSWEEVDPQVYNYQFFDVSPEKWTVPVFSFETAKTLPSFVVRTEDGGYELVLPERQNATISAAFYWYLPYLSEELYAQAMEKLPAEAAFYLSHGKDGYLDLCWEEIRDLEPENAGETGCGIDHEHIFGSSRLSEKAMPNWCGEGVTGVIYRSGEEAVRGSGYLKSWSKDGNVFEWTSNGLDWSAARDPRLAYVPTLRVTDTITAELPDGMTVKWVRRCIPTSTGYSGTSMLWEELNTLPDGKHWIEVKLTYEKDGVKAEYEDVLRLDIQR